MCPENTILAWSVTNTTVLNHQNIVTSMARELSDTDIEILYKLVPELKAEGSRPKYRSILPPVSKFYAGSDEDFKQRLEKLSEKELEYIVNLIFDGMECLQCIRESHVGIVMHVVSEKLSEEKGKDLKEFCGIFEF